MNSVDLTEQNVMKFLSDTSKDNGEVSPRVIVASRMVDMTNPQRTITRTVRFALIVSTDNETLVDALIQACLVDDMDVYFVGSDVNLQSDMEVDYLFFEAKIMSKKTGGQ